MSIFTDEDSQSLPEVGLDLGVFGQRLRHLRRARGLTLAELGAKVGRAPSVLSLLENGRREPKLSLIEALAAALGVPADELMRRQPPSRRAQLEIALAEAQRDPVRRRPRAAAAAGGRPGAQRGDRAHPGPARRAAPAPGQADRHPRGGPRGQRGPARDDARPGQLLRRDRGGRRGRAGHGRLLGRRAVARHAAVGGQPARLLRALRVRRAAPRPAPSPTCATAGSTCGRRRWACTPRARCCCRPWATSCSATRRRPTSPSSCASGSRPTTSRPRCWCPSRAAAAFLARGQGGQGTVGRGPARRVLGVLRDGRAPVHQPGHPPPRRALPLREERRGRGHLQGLRERRRAVPGRRGGVHRGPADVPVLVRAAGVLGRRQAQPVLPVLRHAVGHLLVHGAGRPPERGFAITLGVPLRGLALVPRPRDDPPDGVGLPGRRLLPAPARPRWPRAGTARPGRRPGPTRTSCWPCPSGSFPGVDEADVFEFLERHEKDD